MKVKIPLSVFKQAKAKACIPGKRFIASFMNDYTEGDNIVMTKTQIKKVMNDFALFYDRSRVLQRFAFNIHARVFSGDILRYFAYFKNSDWNGMEDGQSIDDITDRFLSEYNYIKVNARKR